MLARVCKLFCLVLVKTAVNHRVSIDSVHSKFCEEVQKQLSLCTIHYDVRLFFGKIPDLATDVLDDFNLKYARLLLSRLHTITLHRLVAQLRKIFLFRCISTPASRVIPTVQEKDRCVAVLFPCHAGRPSRTLVICRHLLRFP